MRHLVLCIIVGLLLVPSLSAEEEAWAVHAEDDVSTLASGGLSEVYLPSGLDDAPTAPEGYVQWNWWAWSDEVGSDWPDDDALYRASNRNISLNQSDAVAVVENHPLAENKMLELAGKVKVVSAEDRVRMVAFDLSLTPLQNLSNHTILYVVLTENIAEDQHRRQAERLVREMRPEVAFSVKANTTTEVVSMLPADHLAAAGVDLGEEPTGWSYSVAVFGSEAEENGTPRLLALAHGDLPAPSRHTGMGEAWPPLLLSAITAVIAVFIVLAVRQREQAIPKLQARWHSEQPTSIVISIQAGHYNFRITNWQVTPPWRFRGRPPKLNLDAGESRSIVVDFREPHPEDCHLEVAIDIEEYGAWRQHLWLKAGEGHGQSHPEEE